MLKKLLKLQIFGWALTSCVCNAGAISPSEAREVVEVLRERIEQNYVSQKTGRAVVARLSSHEVIASLNGIRDTKDLESRLNSLLQTFDKHLGVQWRDPQAREESRREAWFSKLDRKHSGFTRVELLDGNVGYVDFWGFDEVSEQSKARLEAVITFVADSDALILDLRKNGGGSPDMVRLISSYLFKKPVHLNSMYWKSSGSMTESWTLSGVSAGRLASIPIYVLTSGDTFSAAEEFAYNLQQLKRATVIGEVTKGGANPWRYFALTDEFRAAIPIARAVNPISKTNWEHVGVRPHVVVARSKALAVAYCRALKSLRGSVKNPYQLEEINRQSKKLRDDFAAACP